jgi:alkanesulfonate monooxygenase SsuD/methylene tetrahydromethanopterin reductase-like flavin-dependent oxidoreductase (luciferase family)
MSSEPTDLAQLPVAESYLAALQASHGAHGIGPRIGLSRAVYPADDRRTAIAHLEAGVAAYVDTMIERGFFPRGLSQEAYFARTHIHYGHSEQVIASLQADRLLPMTTELIVQAHPGHPTPDQFLRALERVAKDVAPALGWCPGKTSPPDRSLRAGEGDRG